MSSMSLLTLLKENFFLLPFSPLYTLCYQMIFFFLPKIIEDLFEFPKQLMRPW